MALFERSPLRPVRRTRSAVVLRPVSIAFACALAAGCAGGGGGGDASAPGSTASTGSRDAAAVALAGEAYQSAVSKPMGPNPAVASAAGNDGSLPIASVAPTVVAGKVRYGVPSTVDVGLGQTLRGTVPFPVGDAWNRDLTRAAIDPSSAALIASIGAQATLKIGFGALAGVPYAIVDRMQGRATVRIAGDATARAWPIPTELQPSADGDARLAVIDRDAGLLYELRGASRRADGSWDALGAASWRLDVADAAPVDAAGAPASDGGLPVFPGLVRRDEVEAGVIRHALRVTIPALRAAWLAPARYAAAGASALDASLPPVGMRLRLKADTLIPADAGPQARVILQALKTYGLVVAAVGTALSIEGVPDAGWDVAKLSADLAQLRGEHFEVLAMDAIATP